MNLTNKVKVLAAIIRRQSQAGQAGDFKASCAATVERENLTASFFTNGLCLNTFRKVLKRWLHENPQGAEGSDDYFVWHELYDLWLESHG